MSFIACSIIILLHEVDPYPRGSSYFIWGLRDAWLEMGLDVRVAKGLKELEPADLVIPHIDLTVTPPEYRAALDALPNVANKGLYDISKRRISAWLVSPDDGWDGPVIIKTDRNSGGRPDRRVARLQRSVPRRLVERLWRALGGHSSSSAFGTAAGRGDYQVVESRARVPAETWNNPDLVVERFLPEYDGHLYYVRWYIFIGDRYRLIRAGGPRPTVKLSNVSTREVGLPVPAEVLAFRQQHKLDFGKIDFVMHQGTPVILDLNRTPADEPPPTRLAICRPYAAGVLPLLEGRSPCDYRDVDA